MKTTMSKRDGFYMNVTSEERILINKLQEEYAINISQAFKLFLKQMLDRMIKNEKDS
jgi:hypothetical protein